MTMTKFTDELFTDLMRQYRTTLEHLDRSGAADVVIRPRAERGLTGPRRRRPSWLAPVAAAVGVLLAVGLAVGLGGLFTGRSHPAGQATTMLGQTAWVFNGTNGTLTPISPVTGRLGRPIKVGPGQEPFKVHSIGGQNATRTIETPSITQNVISPDGTTDYVVYTSEGLGSVLRPVSLVNGRAGRAIPLGAGAGQVAVTPNGTTAYVPYSSYRPGRTASVRTLETAARQVRPISLATGRVGKPIVHGDGTATISITPDGATAYITFADSGTVFPISTATSTPGPAIRVPEADRIVFTADGATADVISADNTVTPISTATNTAGKPVRTGPARDTVDITPDGTTAFVTNVGSSVTPVSLTTGRAGKPIKLKGAGSLVFTPDSKTAYYVNVIYSRVTPVSTATDTTGKPMNVSGWPLYITISPDGKTVYVNSSGGSPQTIIPISTATNTPGKPIKFRAQNVYVLVPGGWSY
ncbi:MAG TPA: YncE family protein [Streptosporangiaceae bacterium]|jgi:DNA-binding beta-propeller fold protein YncE